MAKGILQANKQLKGAFLGALSFGIMCVLIVSLNDGIPSIWVLILSFIPLGFYIVYGQKLSKKHQDDVGFSDSVYYLGFTLTLISLFFAIVNERMTGGASTEMTLQYFGFALGTTIVGIIYRTVNNQFLYDENTLPKGEAERISDEIDGFANSMHELKSGIAEASSTIKQGMPALSQDLSEGYKQLGTNIRELAQSTSDSKALFNTSMGDISRPLGEAIKKISDDLNNQDISIDRSIFYELETNLKKVNEEFATSISNISEHLNEQKIDASVFTKLSNNLNSLNGKFEKMNDKFDTITSSYATALHSMNANNIKALEESKKLNKELDRIKDPSFLGRVKRTFFG